MFICLMKLMHTHKHLQTSLPHSAAVTSTLSPVSDLSVQVAFGHSDKAIFNQNLIYLLTIYL